MQRQIHILPEFSGYRDDAICFETQCSPDEVGDLSKFAFEHGGPGYTPFSTGALRLFHERLLLGQDMPANLILTKWYRLDQLMAAALFIRPDLALAPECSGIVNSFDLLDRLGDSMQAHVPFEHKELAITLGHFTTAALENQASISDSLEVVRRCADLIVRYVEEGQLPPLSQPPEKPTVLVDDMPFVAFVADSYCWDQFYQEGFLYGIWIRPNGTVFASRKSNLVGAFAPENVLKRFLEVEPEAGWEIIGQGTVVGTPDSAEDFLKKLLQS